MNAPSASQDQWYIAENGQKSGPFPRSELVRRAANGELDLEQYVIRQGETQWRKAREVDGLLQAVRTHDTAANLSDPHSHTERGAPGGPPANALFPTIPGYTIHRKLGQGSMGVVYEATDNELERPVALKLLHDAKEGDDVSRERFLREARAVARLKHPNIVQIYHIGKLGEQLYLVLEFVKGMNLAEALQRQTWSLRETVNFIIKVARAVHAAHAEHIVHRDLKPANILLDERGDPMITDFGIAKDLSQARPLTRIGALVGTLAYMAPEQADGRVKDIDPRTDVYALGVILYEMLTGSVPFSGPMAALLHKIMYEEPTSLRKSNPRIPHELDVICLKCLEKDPLNRYSSALELVNTFRAVFSTSIPTSGTKGTDSEAVIGWSEAVLWKTIPAHTGSVMSVAFSPNGKWIVSGGADGMLKVWDAISCQQALILPGHTGDVSGVSFSPDSKRIVSGSLDGTIKLWAGTPAQEALALKGHPVAVRCVAFSPDGKRIISASTDKTLKVWDAITGQEVLTLEGHTAQVRCVVCSPDGKWIVSGGLDHTVKVWDAITGQEVLALKGHTNNVLSLAFSPDGKRIVSGSADNTLRVWDAMTGQEALTLQGHTGGVYSVALSPDGNRIVSASSDKTLTIWDAVTGEEVLTLEGHTAFVMSVAFSPNGKRIVSGSSDHTIKVWHARRF